MPLDFHVHTKESLIYKCRSPKDWDWLKAQENQRCSRTPSLVMGRRRRRLSDGPGFEKMGVASWHIQTLPRQIPSTFGADFSLFIVEYGGQVGLHGHSPLVWNQACPGHQNIHAWQLTWKPSHSKSTTQLESRCQVLSLYSSIPRAWFHASCSPTRL